MATRDVSLAQIPVEVALDRAICLVRARATFVLWVSPVCLAYDVDMSPVAVAVTVEQQVAAVASVCLSL